MSSNKVHSHGNVPFSWENKPGVSKVGAQDRREDDRKIAVKLPPPPCPPETARAASFHDLQIPLPPCGFQAPLRSSSRKSVKNKDDPFLMAYRECTKSNGKGKLSSRDDVGLGSKKNMSFFSCKRSCSVREDSLIRISQLPISKSQREREMGS
ncbi:unnamed protein product [Ilex paraguariensis]|uniref:Uncharacterized protein n=1 Tax=Ilex paraguariensis TaxID=185542 RepID=A0ABC8R4X7_9AQUA